MLDYALQLPTESDLHVMLPTCNIQLQVLTVICFIITFYYLNICFVILGQISKGKD